MKRLNLILIAATFAMTTACSDAERVVPYQPQEEASFYLEKAGHQQNTENISQAPNEEASLTQEDSNNCGCGKKEAEEKGGVHYGELLPASFMDCGTFIRKKNGQLLEVRDLNVPARYAEKGAQVRFGYIYADVEPSCGIGSVVDLTHLSFMNADDSQQGADETAKTPTDPAKGSATN